MCLQQSRISMFPVNAGNLRGNIEKKLCQKAEKYVFVSNVEYKDKSKFQ